jgi:hypothetical protein
MFKILEQTTSQLVAVATRSDTGSHNRFDLIQSLVPQHYVCNGYILNGILIFKMFHLHRFQQYFKHILWYQHTMYVISLSNIS